MLFEDRFRSAAFSGYRGEKMGFPMERPSLRDQLLRMRLERAVVDAVQDGYETFYCGAAWGFDILAGETVIGLKLAYPALKLCCALPFPGQDRGWSAPWRARFCRLLDAADRVEAVAPAYSRTCFHERNRFMVDRAELLICYFDGKPGGTAYTVQYAHKRGLQIVNVCENARGEAGARLDPRSNAGLRFGNPVI